MKIAYEGKGPGIVGAPVWDGHEFAGSATVADPAGWMETLADSFDGSSMAMTKPLLQEWNDFFASQTSWATGTGYGWRTADERGGEPAAWSDPPAAP